MNSANTFSDVMLPRSLTSDAKLIQQVAAGNVSTWHAGELQTHAGALKHVRYRYIPRRISIIGVWLDQRISRVKDDHCHLYWHRGWFQPRVLAVDYVRSGPKTSIATFHRAVQLIDALAELQNCLVAVCHVTNERISDRLLARWGWEPHCLNWRGRHFIRRYYDQA